MNKIFKVFFLLAVISPLFSKYAFTQQSHFLYIQADDKQTFSVSLNGKKYTSSDIGYVIIPKLTDGKYQLTVSFPENKFPDQQFNCVINKNDAGYALKNFEEKGWGLFNLQTLDVTMAGTDVPDIPKDTTNPNAFGEMLSDVMRDTTLKKAGIELQQAEKQKEITGQSGGSNPSVVLVPTLNDSLLSAQRQDSGLSSSRSIMKISEHRTGTGTSMIFIDAGTGDTIKVFLPKLAESAMAKEQELENKGETDSTLSKTAGDSSVTVKTGDSNAVAKAPAAAANENENKPAETKSENANPIPPVSEANNNTLQPNNPFYNGAKKSDSTDNITSSSGDSSSQNNQPSSPPAFKQDCKKMLADNDLDKLKKKMVSSNSDDKMIQTMKKYVADKCLTTDQVKSLGLLFLTDDGRYNFFDAVYKNVYDLSAFSSLESQLIDPYYKKRFQAMLK